MNDQNSQIQNAFPRENRYDRIVTNGKPPDTKFVWTSSRLFTQPLFVRCALEMTYHGNCLIEHHNSRYSALEFLLDGELRFSFDGKTHLLKKGMIAFLHRNRNNGFSSPPDGFYRKIALILSGVQLDFLIQALHLDSCNFLAPRDPADMERRFREIQTILKQRTPGTERLESEHTYSLLLNLADEWNDGRSVYPPALLAALDFMESNFSRPIACPDIAYAAHCSSSTLTRIFRKYMNTTPGTWLTEQRMRFAAQLLESGTVRVKDAAAAAGYENPLNFSTAFREYFGYSPRAHRERKEKSGSNL